MSSSDRASACCADDAIALPKYSHLSIAGRFAGFLRIWRGRRLVKSMRDFDDAMLADIGLRRADVEEALRSAPGIDPSLQLNRFRQDPLRHRRRF